jgi:exonuclease VII large subunit
MSENQQGSGILLSAGDLNQLFAEIANRKLRTWEGDLELLVRSFGTVSSISDKIARAKELGWSKILGGTLACDGNVYFDSSLALVQHFKDGDHVEVTGLPIITVYNGSPSFRLKLLSIKAAEGIEAQVRRSEDQANLNALRSYKAKRNPFPTLSTLTLNLIHSSATSAQVDDDFTQALGSSLARIDVKPIPVRMSSPSAIAEAIRSSSADVLAIVRGGGSESDFTAFNDPVVLSALADHPGYRVVGLGHSANSTMLDLICDHSAATPSAAGTHINEQIKSISLLASNFEKIISDREQEISDLEQQLDEVRFRPPAAVSVEEPNSTPPIAPTHAPHQQVQGMSRKLFWGVLAVLVVLYILK